MRISVEILHSHTLNPIFTSITRHFPFSVSQRSPFPRVPPPPPLLPRSPFLSPTFPTPPSPSCFPGDPHALQGREETPNYTGFISYDSWSRNLEQTLVYNKVWLFSSLPFPGEDEGPAGWAEVFCGERNQKIWHHSEMYENGISLHFDFSFKTSK